MCMYLVSVYACLLSNVSILKYTSVRDRDSFNIFPFFERKKNSLCKSFISADIRKNHHE